MEGKAVYDSTPLLIFQQEVAQKLNVSERTVYNLIKAGELKAIRVGKNVRIPRDSLNLFISRSCETGRSMAKTA